MRAWGSPRRRGYFKRRSDSSRPGDGRVWMANAAWQQGGEGVFSVYDQLEKFKAGYSYIYRFFIKLRCGWFSLHVFTARSTCQTATQLVFFFILFLNSLIGNILGRRVYVLIVRVAASSTY